VCAAVGVMSRHPYFVAYKYSSELEICARLKNKLFHMSFYVFLAAYVKKPEVSGNALCDVPCL
jgi:hypothetical protein